MEKRKLPKVLLLGNGLNRAYAGESWKSAIQKMWCNPKVCKDDKKVQALPFPLQVVVATNDSVDAAIQQRAFETARDNPDLQAFCLQLLDIGFDHILTTNYTYELEAAAYPKEHNLDTLCKKLISHTDAVKRAEGKYLLHTYNRVRYDGKENKIWHIHGESRKCQSVVLGHYYYGNLLGKYHQELDKRQNKQHLRQMEGKEPIMDSWLDAFIMGDVYILGFGFDFSEMDLWWLLNRKKREKADHGKVYYYEPAYGYELKQSLLETYGAEVRNLGYRAGKPDYRRFYQDALNDIRITIESDMED